MSRVDVMVVVLMSGGQAGGDWRLLSSDWGLAGFGCGVVRVSWAR
ncbi:MAG TPA: hypothetical protein VM848_19960 [Acidimicrobiia bacterium]|nr:hypothetical protein [Acidimicrobiia bacterium]